jgi:hypothetical protein
MAMPSKNNDSLRSVNVVGLNSPPINPVGHDGRPLEAFGWDVTPNPEFTVRKI